jgi:hypothetical protein
VLAIRTAIDVVENRPGQTAFGAAPQIFDVERSGCVHVAVIL